MGNTNIEWTKKTWNPATGCTQVSPGCDNCYAKRLIDVRQSKNPKSPRYGHPFEEVMLHPERLDQPSRWGTASTIFVNSMSDLFHVDIPDGFLDRAFAEMERSPRHTFQILTKRSERMKRYVNKRYPNPAKPCPEHIWLGVSVEAMEQAWRANDLRGTNAAIRWISAEPLIASLDGLNLDEIDWLVAGGESGPDARPIAADWVRELRDKCIAGSVAFFFKQWGGKAKKNGGAAAVLDAVKWGQYPVVRRPAA